MSKELLDALKEQAAKAMYERVYHEEMVKKYSKEWELLNDKIQALKEPAVKQGE